MVIENCNHLLNRLDEQSRSIATARMNGSTNREIATALGCGLRTVERKLELIRRVWDHSEGDGSG